MVTEPPDGPTEQLLRVLERLPFVSGLKRDVSAIRGLVYSRRAPRIAAIGRPGSGRTTLGNALIGKSALPTDRSLPVGEWVRVDAEGARVDWLELDIDSADPPADRADGGDRADRLARALGEAHPDVVLLCASPSSLDSGLGALLGGAERALERIERQGEPRPPIVAVLTRVDELPPEAVVGTAWSEEKLQAIELAVQRLERATVERGLVATRHVAFASPKHGASHGVEALAQAVFDVLPEPAHLEAARAFPGATDERREVANRIVHACSTLALTVGLAPVPLSDVFIIAPLQVLMVSTVAHLGGRPWNRKAALEWIASMGVVGGAGLGFRWTAQQLVKLIPGAGSIVSAGVAGAGTATLGQSAIAYFLRDRRKELTAAAHAPGSNHRCGAFVAHPELRYRPRAMAHDDGIPLLPERLNMADWFLDARVREGKGGRAAVRVGDRALTYAEVQARANRVRHALADRGIDVEDRVLLLLPDGVEFVEAWFGRAQGGRRVLHGQPARHRGRHRLPARLHARARGRRARIDARSARARAREHPRCRVRLLVGGASEGWERVGGRARGRERSTDNAVTARDDLAGWLFTCGSTGQPKGACTATATSPGTPSAMRIASSALREDDVFVSVSRLFFGYATGTNLMFPFSVGGTAVLFPDSRRPTAVRRDRAARRHRADQRADDDQQDGRPPSAAPTSAIGAHVPARRRGAAARALPRWRSAPRVEILDGIGSAEMFHIYISNCPGDVKPGSPRGASCPGYEATDRRPGR